MHLWYLYSDRVSTGLTRLRKRLTVVYRAPVHTRLSVLPPPALTFLFVEDIERLEQLVFGAFHHPHPGLLLILKCPAEETEPHLSSGPFLEARFHPAGFRIAPRLRLETLFTCVPLAPAVSWCSDKADCQNRQSPGELLPPESRKGKRI